MPSPWPTNDSQPPKRQIRPGNPGQLYVVSTPIGHARDITLRALDILDQVDCVAAEDTRKTGRFLAQHQIRAALVSYHEHNETRRTPELLRKLQEGQSVALVSDAGTPTVSDPGYSLIQAALAEGIRITPIPGVSAVVTALSVAGLPTDSFIFVGFAPKKKGKRLEQLKELASQPRTIVYYESAQRLLQFLGEVQEIMGDRHGVLAREMTKLHEEFMRGPISELIRSLRARPTLKGECTLLIAGAAKEVVVSDTALRQALMQELAADGSTLSHVVKAVSAHYGVSKKRVYAEALKIKDK